MDTHEGWGFMKIKLCFKKCYVTFFIIHSSCLVSKHDENILTSIFFSSNYCVGYVCFVSLEQAPIPPKNAIQPQNGDNFVAEYFCFFPFG